MTAPQSSSSFALASPASVRGQFSTSIFARSLKAIPVSPNQDGANQVSKGYEDNSRTFSTRTKLSNVQLRTEISAVLLQFPAKDIAKAAGSSLGTAQNARDGYHTISLPHFINLCRDIPELRALALRLMGCEGHTDPEFIKGLHHLIASYTRREP